MLSPPVPVPWVKSPPCCTQLLLVQSQWASRKAYWTSLTNIAWAPASLLLHSGKVDGESATSLQQKCQRLAHQHKLWDDPANTWYLLDEMEEEEEHCKPVIDQKARQVQSWAMLLLMPVKLSLITCEMMSPTNKMQTSVLALLRQSEEAHPRISIMDLSHLAKAALYELQGQNRSTLHP